MSMPMLPAAAGMPMAESVASPVRIPADVEREDRVLAGLTLRQLAILVVVGLVLYAAYAATRTVVPPLAFALAVAAPVAVASALVVLGSRDGLSLDRLLLAALRQRLAPRIQVAAPEGVPAAPDWLTAHALRSDPATSTVGRVAPSALRLPAEAVTEAGAIDLGSDGTALVAVASTVNFALRTPAEQEALVSMFGRYLHSLTAPVQILIRAQRLDLSSQITELNEAAGALPHPALEAAAREHAQFLTQLAGQTDLLRRQVLLVLREPAPARPAARVARVPGLVLPRRGELRCEEQDAARRAAETRLARRLGEAASLLAGAGIVITPLDPAQATAVLAGACNPDTLIPLTAPLAAAEDIITTAGTSIEDELGHERRLGQPHPTQDTSETTYADEFTGDVQDEPASPSLDQGEAWWSR